MKKVKSRKDRECDLCVNGIKKGEWYWYFSTRLPDYEVGEDGECRQVGIEYMKGYVCDFCKEETETIRS